MNILLLAAGMGTRLGKRTEALPKSLIPVKGKPLLNRILESFLSFSVEKIVIVTGFEKEKVGKTAAPYGDRVETVFNADFRKGNLLSVLNGQEKIKSPFAVFNADHYYSRVILEKILGYDGNEVCAVCDFDRPLADDDMKVRLQSGRLSSMSKKMEKPDCGYVGITLVPEALEQKYWEAAGAVLKEKGEGAHAEMVLNHLAISREVEILDISGSAWIEVDTPEDLARAEAKIDEIDER